MSTSAESVSASIISVLDPRSMRLSKIHIYCPGPLLEGGGGGGGKAKQSKTVIKVEGRTGHE